MRPRFLAAIMLLMLCFATTVTADQWYGEFYADGYGKTEAHGAENAMYTLEGIIEGWEDILKPGQEIMIVIGDSKWDDPQYTITYWVIVLDTAT